MQIDRAQFDRLLYWLCVCQCFQWRSTFVESTSIVSHQLVMRNQIDGTFFCCCCVGFYNLIYSCACSTIIMLFFHSRTLCSDLQLSTAKTMQKPKIIKHKTVSSAIDSFSVCCGVCLFFFVMSCSSAYYASEIKRIVLVAWSCCSRSVFVSQKINSIRNLLTVWDRCTSA